eukprot:TRINITY_DN133_c0_g1_i10.p1 TRINITY_DN133_c0_g1~~TRINITY_DN133_c0_g1_i10.p1  ORF type:complete len:101 (-),score=5.96 TRINITY_DN133_c0_g1_i10:83-385(-)
MTKGTFSFGRRHTKTHGLCRRCGEHSFHIQRSRCAACGSGVTAKRRRYEWSMKAIRRRTTGTGRMRHLKIVNKQQTGLKRFNQRYNSLVHKHMKKNQKLI